MTLLVKSQESISNAMGVCFTSGMASVALAFVECKTAFPRGFDLPNRVSVGPVCARAIGICRALVCQLPRHPGHGRGDVRRPFLIGLHTLHTGERSGTPKRSKRCPPCGGLRGPFYCGGNVGIRGEEATSLGGVCPEFEHIDPMWPGRSPRNACTAWGYTPHAAPHG
jgi:hypothetical protein